MINLGKFTDCWSIDRRICFSLILYDENAFGSSSVREEWRNMKSLVCRNIETIECGGGKMEVEACQKCQRLMQERFWHLLTPATYTHVLIEREVSDVDLSSIEPGTHFPTRFLAPSYTQAPPCYGNKFPNHQFFCVTFNVSEVNVFRFVLSNIPQIPFSSGGDVKH